MVAIVCVSDCLALKTIQTSLTTLSIGAITALGTPTGEVIGYICPGEKEACSDHDLCGKAPLRISDPKIAQASFGVSTSKVTISL
ncbi:hypothetical protein NBRC116597_28250 [Phaeobacter sp. NW0010-22]